MSAGVGHGVVGECRTVTLAVALAGEKIVDVSTEKSALWTEKSKAGFRIVGNDADHGLAAIVVVKKNTEWSA